jgi:hypothetical protein
MQATSVTQATTVTPATSNIKDDSNIMTAHKSRNASNSRNESNNRTANIVWTPSKAGMLAKTASNSMEGGQQQQRQWEHHSVNSRMETRNNKEPRNSRD